MKKILLFCLLTISYFSFGQVKSDTEMGTYNSTYIKPGLTDGVRAARHNTINKYFIASKIHKDSLDNVRILPGDTCIEVTYKNVTDTVCFVNRDEIVLYLDDLLDVDLTDVDSQDILRFDDESNLWKNVPMPDFAAAEDSSKWRVDPVGGDTIKTNYNVVVDSSLTLKQNLYMPVTTATVGQIKQGGDRVFHNFQHPTGGDVPVDGHNLFIGKNAGNFTIGENSIYTEDGSYNIGIGESALLNANNAQQNVSIGYEALKECINGSYNVAIGSQTMANSRSSSGNVAIGSGAMSADTDGVNNVAIGNGAMGANINGTENVAIGNGALTFNTIGGSNVGIGTGSLSQITTQIGNTALGFFSGYSNMGDSNVFIGYNTGRYFTGSNRLIIDSGDKGSEENDSTQSLIFGNFATDKLTINGTLTTDNTFAELFEDASNVTATIATYRTIVSLQTGDFNEAVLTDSTITVNQAGTYLINYSSSFTHSVNSTLCHISLFVNDVEDTSLEAERKIGTVGDYGSMSGTALVALSANDVLKLKAKSDNNGNLTVAHMNFNVTRIK